MHLRFTTKWVAIAVIGGAAVSGAFAQTTANLPSVIWIGMQDHIRLKKEIKPGTALEGTLARGVYWRDAVLFPKGSSVKLVVDSTELRKKTGKEDDRPFFVRLFSPRHDVALRFRSVTIKMPSGVDVPLRGTFIALAQRGKLNAEVKQPSARIEGEAAAAQGSSLAKPKPQKAPAPWIMTLEVEPERTPFPVLAERLGANQGDATAACQAGCTIAGGTRMPVLLLEGLSASRSHKGQTFQAELLEPVRVGSRVVIPQGAVLQGVLEQRIPPRRLYRPGSLKLLFTNLTLPNGSALAIAAFPVGAEVDRGTHMTMDAEGKIHAQGPGKARFLLDFGISGGLSKVADDTTQLIIEAFSSTATDASTAGVAKLAALGATGIYLLTRHGRDVILPAFTEMDLRLSRAVSLGSVPPAAKAFH